MTLRIENKSCIACGKCVQVCPAGIMVRSTDGKGIEAVRTDRCIGCGHCVDVCPTGSVIHSDFPPQRVHTVDTGRLPAPEQVLELIRARRSNRALTPHPIPDEALQRIVEAARYAPTASNSRQVSFTLVTEPEQLLHIADFTVGVFASTARKLLHPVVRTLLKPLRPDLYRYAARFAEIEREHEAGNDPILRRATALLIIHTPASNRFGCEDANLAYQNASLMAESLGVSQIYMGFVLTAARMGRKNAFARIAGITGRPQHTRVPLFEIHGEVTARPCNPLIFKQRRNRLPERPHGCSRRRSDREGPEPVPPDMLRQTGKSAGAAFQNRLFANPIPFFSQSRIFILSLLF